MYDCGAAAVVLRGSFSLDIYDTFCHAQVHHGLTSIKKPR